MRKFLLFWKYDQLELCLQKQSVLCDWLLTLITFVASLGIVDALFTSRFTKKIAAVKPVPHSVHLVPEVQRWVRLINSLINWRILFQIVLLIRNLICQQYNLKVHKRYNLTIFQKKSTQPEIHLRSFCLPSFIGSPKHR